MQSKNPASGARAMSASPPKGPNMGIARNVATAKFGVQDRVQKTAAAARSASVLSSDMRSRSPSRTHRSGRAQLGISHRVHDVAMSQEVLQRAGIDPLIG